MQASRLENGGKGFAFGLIEAYFIVMVTWGVVGLGFTGRFLYRNRGEFSSLVEIIRYRAKEDGADVDLENGRNDGWEMDTVHSDEDDPAGEGYSDTTTEDESNPRDDDDVLCTEDHRHGWTCPRNYQDWNTRCNKHENDGWPAHIEILDNEGDADNEAEEDDPAGEGYGDTETDNEEDPNKWWCRFCGSHCYNEWDHDWPCYGNEGENNAGEGDHGWSRHDKEDDNKEDEADDEQGYPGSNNDSDVLHLTPSSSGSDAEVNTTTLGPPSTYENWYATADDNESCSSCDSEHAKTIPWVTPAAHREPVTPTSPSGYVAGVEDNDDGEESDISDGATIGEPEDGDPKTWYYGKRKASYGSTPGQRFQSEREATGALNNVLEPRDQSTSAQEQRPRPTGTALSSPSLKARHTNILADETGQDPPVGQFRHGIARPLRLIIPTHKVTNSEPGAPTTPVTTHSLA